MGASVPGVEDACARFEALARELAEAIARALEFEESLDPARLVAALAAAAAADPEGWRALYERHIRTQLELWARLAAPPGAGAPALLPDPGDRRFQAREWRAHPYFAYLVQSYLLAGRWLREVLAAAKLEAQVRRKLDFLARQFLDAMSPANFLWTNPEALRLAAESGGASLARGLEQLAADLAKGRISMTDESAFRVGVDLAVTPGAVVHENALMQLLQYRPATATVFERPLVMVPPCINKYYVLDLRPENSFVRFAVERGHTVFMVSWRNVPPELGATTWDDYIARGVIEALEAAGAICGGARVNALGFCVGGTLLGSALAVLAARGARRVASATLLASMLDFSDTGELGLFVDEASVRRRERELGAGGLLRGSELALAFASVRANELIWRSVVNHYLKGQKPEPFDLLYWNADSTNLPGPMYVYYLRNMYLENNLRVPGRLAMCGVPVDLGAIALPAYVLAAREDHIVPWRTAYASARLLGSRIEFVLAASGHIAGVVNPPAARRRNFWTGGEFAAEPDGWLASATSIEGSWWNHWAEWIERHAGPRVPARAKLGMPARGEIEPAPGRYVLERCV